MNLTEVRGFLSPRFLTEEELPDSELNGLSLEEATSKISKTLYSKYLKRRNEWTLEQAEAVERQISTQVLANVWNQHVNQLGQFKQNVLARPERNTEEDYVKEGGPLLSILFDSFSVDTVLNLLIAQVEIKPANQ